MGTAHPTPILLHSRDPRRGELVVACNQAAIERGVRLQMPLAEAAALAQHGGECVIRPHDPAADLAALARLAEHCERFSPIVGWKTVQGPKSKVQSPKPCSDLGPWTLDFGPATGPDCLFLDVTGIGVLFGGEECLAAEVVAEVDRLNYAARASVADTIGAAWAAARSQESGVRNQESDECGVRSAECGVSALVLSTQYSVLSTEPRSEIHLRPCPLRTPHSAFRTFSLEALRLPQETLDLLAELGIVRLEQLLALPRESLRARFGERLLLRVDQLLGTAQEMIVPHRPPPQFTEERVLEYPAQRREQIEQVAGELVRRIAKSLADRREGVVQLMGRFDCAPGRPIRFQVGLFRPSADAGHLWDLMQMQLEQASLSGAVGRVRLEATITAPLENRQGELFASGEHEANRQFALLIDRCSSRLGPDKVLCPELTADPLPERAVRYRKGVGDRGSGVGSRGSGVGARGSGFRAQKTKVGRRGVVLDSVLGTEYSVLNPNSGFASDPRLPPPDSLLLRPLYLYSPPLLLAAISIVPSGSPVSFQFQDRRYDVVHQAGPERIETGWWRGKSVRRDYWRVETTTGQRLWLFRQLADGQWYLHGEYS